MSDDNIAIVLDHDKYVRKMLIGILSKPFDTYYESMEKQKRDLVIREFVQTSMKKKETEKVALTLENSDNAVTRETIINTINQTKQDILDELCRSKHPGNEKLRKSGAAQSKKKNLRQKKLKNNPKKSPKNSQPSSKRRGRAAGNDAATNSAKTKSTQRTRRRNANSTRNKRSG